MSVLDNKDFEEEKVVVEEDTNFVQPSMEERREIRRKRRVRNETLATLAAAGMVLVLGVGLVAGIRGVNKLLGANTTTESSTATESDNQIADMVESMLASETELPTEVSQEETANQKLDEYIDTIIAGMTLEEKVYGLIITSPEQLTGVSTATQAGSGTQTAITEKPVGGLVYYRRNMESSDQLKEMLNNTISYSKYPIFLAVNEGGDSASSVQNSAIEVPAVKEPGEVTEASEAYALGSTIGTYLADLGFNVNFAPTADILWTSGAAVEDYCFGGDSAMNGEFVQEYVTGLEEKGISATLKTFPGTGNLTESTVDGTVSTDKTREDYASDFAVFKAGIDAGADFVMVSHIVASELSGGMDPCSMSSTVVTNILRGELGFEGVIITEPMNGKAITEYYQPGEAAVAALKAGCDMILLPENLEEAYQGILAGVQDGSVAEARINDSLKRVLRVKYADKLADFAE